MHEIEYYVCAACGTIMEGHPYQCENCESENLELVENYDETDEHGEEDTDIYDPFENENPDLDGTDW